MKINLIELLKVLSNEFPITDGNGMHYIKLPEEGFYEVEVVVFVKIQSEYKFLPILLTSEDMFLTIEQIIDYIKGRIEQLEEK